MAVWALGLNHNTAPQDIRGRFVFEPSRMIDTLKDLKQSLPSLAEVAVLSTCNRTEVYCAADPPNPEHTLHWLARAGQVSVQSLQSHTYALSQAQVARHAFRVASGLDSMVLGEAQILGQIKESVRIAQQAGTLGSTLHQLFQRSFSVAKEVRTLTEIGVHTTSLAAACVRLTGQVFEDLSSINVLLVGAGQMIELCASHFAARQPRRMVIANRTLERGQRLAARFGGEVMRLAELSDRLHEFDVVISCTASSLPLIGLGAVERALKRRRFQPVLMVDLALPRDVEPEVKKLDDVYLYALDDLASIVEVGLAQRQAAVAQADAIIDAGVTGFLHWLDQRGMVPLILELNQQAELWRQTELTRAYKMLALGADPKQVLESMAVSLSNKFLHGALAELHTGNHDVREQARRAIEHFFLRDQR